SSDLALPLPRIFKVSKSDHRSSENSTSNSFRTVGASKRTICFLTDIKISKTLRLNRSHSTTNKSKTNRMIKIAPEPGTKHNALINHTEANFSTSVFKFFNLRTLEGEQVFPIRPFKCDLRLQVTTQGDSSLRCCRNNRKRLCGLRVNRTRRIRGRLDNMESFSNISCNRRIACRSCRRNENIIRKPLISERGSSCVGSGSCNKRSIHFRFSECRNGYSRRDAGCRRNRDPFGF